MLSQLNYNDIKSLQVFIAVVNCKGISAAQSSLNMAQSAISTHLKYLEDKFGFILCQRGRAGFLLTEEGKRVYQACYKLSDSLNLFLNELKNIQADNSELSGTVNIALVDKLSDTIRTALSDTIQKLYEQHPLISLNFETLPPQKIEEKIINNQSDIGIAHFGTQRKEITYYVLSTEKQVVYYGQRHPLKEMTDIDINSLLTDYSWVKRGYALEKDLIPQMPTKMTATSLDMETTLLFILAGTHLGYLPENYASSYVKNKMIFPILSDKTSYSVPIHIGYKHNTSHLTKLVVTKIIETLKQN